MAFSAVSSVWAIEIVEVLPDGRLFLEIHVVFVREELIELVLVGSVRSLELPVQLRRPWFDVDVLHTQVSPVPVE